jgi:hypothetical protein
VQASDHGRTVTAAKHPTFKRQADLTKWLKKNMIPGWMRQQDVLPIFGRGYWHPWDGFDANNNSRFDNSIFIYDLDALGVHDHRRYDALFFHFDPTSGKLLNAGVEEMERQTGFHLTTETESSARE